MRKETLKVIKSYISDNAAVNITGYSFAEMNKFLTDHNIEKVAYSCGVYGINGGLLRDITTGTLYAITARNTALSMAF